MTLTFEIHVGGRRRIHLPHLKLDDWVKDVRHDLVQLQSTLGKTEKVTPERDAKLLRLRSLIQEKTSHPSRNRDGKPVRKVLIATDYISEDQNFQGRNYLVNYDIH